MRPGRFRRIGPASSRRQGSRNRRFTVRADAALRAILDNLNANGGKFEDLSPLAIPGMKRPFAFTKNLPAVRAACPGAETVFDDAVGGIGRVERFPDMPILPARFAIGFFRQAPGFGRRIEAATIRRRRATAVANGNRVVLRSSSRTLASRASTRSQRIRTKSAMASGSLLQER